MELALSIRRLPEAVGTAVGSHEAATIERAKKGDHQAFEALVRQYKDSVLNLARRMVGDVDAAEDVAQEAFIRAYQHLRRFRSDAKFSTWLYRIAVNEARARLRRRRSQQAHHWEKQAYPDRFQPPPEEPTDAPGVLLSLLQELPEKQRATLALFYLQELSLVETSKALGAPVGTVKAWLSRGRERLRRLAKERGLL